jgi:hypothetical protein
VSKNSSASFEIVVLAIDRRSSSILIPPVRACPGNQRLSNGPQAATSFGFLRKQSILIIPKSPGYSGSGRLRMACSCALSTARAVPCVELMNGLDARAKAVASLIHRGESDDLTLGVCAGAVSGNIKRRICERTVRHLASDFMPCRAVLCGEIQCARCGAMGPEQGRERRRDRCGPALPEARNHANGEDSIPAACARHLRLVTSGAEAGGVQQTGFQYG